MASRLRGRPDNTIHLGVYIYGMKKILLIIVHAAIGIEGLCLYPEAWDLITITSLSLLAKLPVLFVIRKLSNPFEKQLDICLNELSQQLTP